MFQLGSVRFCFCILNSDTLVPRSSVFTSVSRHSSLTPFHLCFARLPPPSPPDFEGISGAVNLELLFKPIINQLRRTVSAPFPVKRLQVCLQSRQKLQHSACAARFCCHLSRTLQRVISDLYRGIKRMSLFKKRPLWRAFRRAN